MAGTVRVGCTRLLTTHLLTAPVPSFLLKAVDSFPPCVSVFSSDLRTVSDSAPSGLSDMVAEGAERGAREQTLVSAVANAARPLVVSRQFSFFACPSFTAPPKPRGSCGSCRDHCLLLRCRGEKWGEGGGGRGPTPPSNQSSPHSSGSGERFH